MKILCLIFGHDWFFDDSPDIGRYDFCKRGDETKGKHKCGELMSQEEAEKLLGRKI